MLKKEPWPGWTSGRDKAVLELDISEDDLKVRYGLDIIRDRDDQLGWFSAAHFLDDIVGPVVIYRYDHAPSKAATVFVDSESDLAVAASRIVEVMQLEPSEILVRAA